MKGGGAALSRVVAPDYAQVHIELRRKGVALMLLWAEYRAANACHWTWAHTQFCGNYKVTPCAGQHGHVHHLINP